MSEFRQNLATKEWVVIATERAKRPDDFSGEKRRPQRPPFRTDCPFCPGNEHQTPKEVFAITEAQGWRLRVVPNKFAALSKDTIPQRFHEGRYLKFGGFGIAEVIIETPEHHQTIATMGINDVKNVIEAYWQRYTQVAKDKKLDLITIFRNYGERAGTSLEHPHSQLIASPVVPLRVRNQIEEARRYCDDNGTCVFCDMIQEELHDGRRIVMETTHFLAFEPYASRSPFLTWLIPKAHQSVFAKISPEQKEDLAVILKEVMGKIYHGLGDPDYNYILQSAPVEDDDVDYFHWYIRIIPRLTTAAGFEIGTGIYINVVYPEEAAQFLRDVQVQQ